MGATVAMELFDVEHLRNGIGQRHNYNRILVGNTPYSTVQIRMTLSDFSVGGKVDLMKRRITTKRPHSIPSSEICCITYTVFIS